METKNNGAPKGFSKRRIQIGLFVILVLFGGLAYANQDQSSAENAERTENAKRTENAERTENGNATISDMSPNERKQASLTSFRKVATVLRHPRCLNCHPSGDRPHVGDERRLHDMNVMRGPDNKGVPGLNCEACHRTENQLIPDIPGTPHWHLAPRSMGWEGLDDRELAKMLIDKKRNGNRSFEDLIHHMGEDPLVLWAWEPGGNRSVPPLTHDEFMAALKQWFDTGAELPYEGETTF